MAQLGLGTATFIPGYGLGAVDAVPGAALVRHALAHGVRYVDTAAIYADAERLLGGIAAEIVRENVRVATKMAVNPGASSADVRRHAQDSRERLHQDRVDTLLLHNGTRAHLEDAALADGLRRTRADGLTLKVGASTYGVDDAMCALQQEWCDVVQVEYSLLNQSVMSAIDGRKHAGQEIVARSVLCKGLLTGRRVHASHVPAEVHEALGLVERLAEQWNLTVPALAIRFALDTPGIDVVVVGVSSVEELDTALDAAARDPLTVAQMSMLGQVDRSALDIVHPERWTTAPH